MAESCRECWASQFFCRHHGRATEAMVMTTKCCLLCATDGRSEGLMRETPTGCAAHGGAFWYEGRDRSGRVHAAAPIRVGDAPEEARAETSSEDATEATNKTTLRPDYGYDYLD